VAPLVSLFSVRLGVRGTLAIGTILETAALIVASFSYRLWQLYLTQGVLFGWGPGLLWLGASPFVPQWFTKRRGFAKAIALVGSGAGGLVYSLVVEKILRMLDLAWTFRVTACSTFLYNAASTALIRSRNKMVNPVHSPFKGSLVGNWNFLWIQAWVVLSVMGYTIILFSIPDIVRRLGRTPQEASIASALINAGMAVGRPIVGYYRIPLAEQTLL
jgi:hypothetical protein